MLACLEGTETIQKLHRSLVYSVGLSWNKLSVEYIIPRDIIVALFALIPSFLLVDGNIL